MPFKGISYLELWQPFCSAERNLLCNFGRGYYAEQFCEINLNHLKEIIKGNIHVKLYIHVKYSG